MYIYKTRHMAQRPSLCERNVYIYIYRQTVKEERRKEEEEMVDNGQTLCLSAASSCIVESERERAITNDQSKS